MIIMPYGWPWPIDTAHKPGRLLAPHRLFGAASGVRSKPATSASAGRESLSDGGVPGRGPTQPIAPYDAISYSAEVSIRENGPLAIRPPAELRELQAMDGPEWPYPGSV